MTSKLDRFFNPKDGTYANVPIIPLHPEKYRGKRIFNNNILIGNWYEGQLKFKESLHRSKTFYQIDYPAHVGSVPDTVLRRKVLGAHNLQPGRLILDHHDINDREQHISNYDEQYNRRGAYGENQDTSERKWLILEDRWLPERSDHPLESTPTTWGLIDRKRSESQNLRRQCTMPEISEYSGRYVAHPKKAYSSSKTPGMPHIYTRAIDRTNSSSDFVKSHCMTECDRRQPFTSDNVEPDYTYSLRRSSFVPRALFYLGKIPNQVKRKQLPLETESTNPVLSTSLTDEQI